jgi:DNA-directed RNA polymerase specialized sigma24 family protein
MPPTDDDDKKPPTAEDAPAGPTDAEPPTPPKELASKEEKNRIVNDDALVGELRAKVREHLKGKEDVEEVLQDVLFAISRAPVPKPKDEWKPYCKTIADNMAKKHAKKMQNKPLTRAVSLDDETQGEPIQQRTRTPEAILRTKEAVGFVVARSAGWRGEHRGWFRRFHVDGVSHAEIAAKAGVSETTVMNALSLKRKDVSAWKNLLVYLMGLIGLPILIKNTLYRASAVGQGQTPLAEVESALPFVLIALTAVAVFVGVARVGRARRRVVLAALAASILFAAHSSSIGLDLDGQYWGTFPDRLTSFEAFVMYGSDALVFIGAGGLLAWMAARRFGLKGFLSVLVVSPIVALFVNAVVAEAFAWPWVSVTARDALWMWAERTAVMYGFVWWMGRDPKATATPVVIAEGSTPSPAAETKQPADDDDSAAAE